MVGELIPMVPGFSTTATVAQMAAWGMERVGSIGNAKVIISR
jgi:hypothetical protein